MEQPANVAPAASAAPVTWLDLDLAGLYLVPSSPMALPKDPESRKRVLKAALSLLKLPPAQRKELVNKEMRKRGLVPSQKG
jgi:hypothetical protein